MQENAESTANGKRSDRNSDNISQTNHMIDAANDGQLKKLESRLKLLEKENSELKKKEQLYNATVRNL